jgi:hypothetical protein
MRSTCTLMLDFWSIRIGHDKPESAVTINQNTRSRSAGMTGHDKPESPVTTNQNDRSRSTGIPKLQ